VSAPVLRFWGSAVALALAVTLAAGVLLPYEALQLETQVERLRAWLLAVWTAGVMAVLFGLSGLIAYGGAIGFRDVVEAGSMKAALEARAKAARAAGGLGFHGNFAWWLVSTGALLIAFYFVAWIALGTP
jgi:hypothetical protein